MGAAATKSLMLGVTILITARFFVAYSIIHPLWMLLFLVLTCVTFSLFGFIIGIWAEGFEKLQIIPLMVVTPLTFLGGSFYSINMLPPMWQKTLPFEPRGVPCQRLSLEFLRGFRRGSGSQPRHDRRLFGTVPCSCGLDVQDRLPN